MKLPLPFLKSKQADSDYYLSLILMDEKVGAVILQAENGTLKKINASEAAFTESIEELSMEDLISVVDKAISRAEEILPPNIQTHKTVFGVKENWVEKETKKITKEYLEKLKKVCNALDLAPIGFMVTSEAITHHMQDEEGAPVSAVFAEINKKDITLRLLRGGKVLETVSSPHLESTPATIDKLLGHFTVPVLPARIVVFQSKPDERTSQALLSHHWSKNLPFLHVPQITVLPSEFAMHAVMSGAASQMGFKVIERAQQTLHKVTLNAADEAALAADQKEPQEAIAQSDEPLDDGTEEAVAEASDFGFVLNKDVSEQPTVVNAEPEDEPAHHFSDVSDAHANLREPVYDEPTLRPKRAGAEKKQALLAGITSMKPLAVHKLFDKFKGKAPLKIIIPIVVIILLLGGIVFFYFYKVQAHVTLTMKPNMVNQDQKVTFSSSSPNDFSNNLVAAKAISTSLHAQISTNATGKKDVGEKAKGTITFYNNSASTATVKSGTELKSSNGVVFVLDNDVKMASSSGDIFTGTKPGTADASVTAKELGTEGNIPSGTKFDLGGNNTIAAKNDNAFSGGTKKTVTVVSKDDLVKLRNDLPKSVQGDAKKKLSEQASGDEVVLPLISNPILESSKLSKDVNEEAKQVSITGTVVFTGFAYTKSDLEAYAKSVLKDKYPKEASFADNSVKETVTDAKQKTNKAATATVTLEAGLLPKIDKQDVINNIKNKSFSQAKEILTSLPQVEQADVSFSPSIPLLPLLFPRLPRQISVDVIAH